MQFVGQTHLLRVPLERPDVDVKTLRRLFEETYFNRFQVELADIRANLVNANCSVIGMRADLDLSALIDPAGRRATPGEAMTGRREVHFDGAWHDTPVYWRDHLPAGFSLTGPALVQQMDTTVLIEPGDRASGDRDGNILIEIGGGG
jgi:N-methylhydantoinase A